MKKILFFSFVLAISLEIFALNNVSNDVVVFKFIPGQDAFYSPWGGNGAELARLYSLIDECRAEITSGRIPVCVDGYCASLPTAKENLNTAFVRANRVKSELITHKGLAEEHFITKNYATAYDGHKDMVVVTLHIPAATGEPQTHPAKKEPEPEAKPERQPEPAVEPEPEPAPTVFEPIKPPKPYCFALRTNLLYDALLLPTLGVEWRVSPAVGIKVDGSRSWWGNKHGKVQKIWLVNPEIRWYMDNPKRFYLGASANFGEYNIYRGMIGSLKSKDTGYQGKLWNAGLTAGYQLHLSRSFSLDFNIGLGYSRFDYDTFSLIDGVRVYRAKGRTKNIFGPTQAGISLIWTIGGK